MLHGVVSFGPRPASSEFVMTKARNVEKGRIEVERVRAIGSEYNAGGSGTGVGGGLGVGWWNKIPRQCTAGLTNGYAAGTKGANV